MIVSDLRRLSIVIPARDEMGCMPILSPYFNITAERIRARPVHAGEWLILLAAAAALLVRCVRDQARPLWCDEAYTAFAVSDPSFAHMLEALRDEINSMPPLSFVLGWGIARVIGVSELALRIPSALFIWVGIVLLWLCLRRSLNRWVATWCAVCLPLASPTVLFNTTEARCYGLYFAAYVAAVGLYLRCAEEGAMARREPWLVTLAHGILVATHYVGGLLSALLVAVALVAGLLWPAHRHRYGQYALHGSLGWLAVIPSLPFYLAQRRLVAEVNWIPRPGVAQLYVEMVSGIGAFQVFVIALLIWALVADGKRVASAADGRRTPELMRAIALLAVASQVFLVAVWVESRVASNIFLDRYLFPLSLAWMLAIAFVADSLVARLWQREPGPESERGKVFTFLRDGLWGRRLVLATAAVLLMFVVMKTLRRRESRLVEIEAIQAMRQVPGIPVVTSGAHLHAELGWYRRATGGVSMLNDSHYHDVPIGLRIGAALERYYLPQSMKRLPECVRELEYFLLVNPKPENTDVETFLADQPGWRSTPLGPHTTLWDRRTKSAAE